MRRWIVTGMAMALTTGLALSSAACVNQREQTKRDIQKFMQTASGEYGNETGDRLVLVPVYARMIGMDTMYLERTTKNGTTGRLLSLEPSGDGEKFVQLSYMFTQQGQWRNLLAQPELLTALQPNDVRPAGTCNLKLAEDMNSIEYSCAGGQPQTYQRIQQAHPE